MHYSYAGGAQLNSTRSYGDNGGLVPEASGAFPLFLTSGPTTTSPGKMCPSFALPCSVQH